MIYISNISKHLYDAEGKKVTLKVSRKIIGSGCCGYVRKCSDNILLKEYHSYCYDNCKLLPSVFDIIHSIENNHLLKVYEYFYKTKCSIETPVDGYTCQYIKSDDINLLHTTKEYMLENMYELLILAELLTKQGLYLDDLKRENTILTQSHMVLIDPDAWNIRDWDDECLRLHNINEILDGFIDICISCLNKNKISLSSDYKMITALFEFSKAQIANEDVTQVVNERLKNYKYPIEYIKKRI